MRRKLNRKFTIIYAVLAALVVGTELHGVFGSTEGDTISEHYWWLAESTNQLVHIPMVGLFGWLVYHFIFQATKGKGNATQDEKAG